MSNKKTSIAAILTCHNRKEKTLKSLSNLMVQQGLEEYELAIYLVDDGSTDGTSNAVKQHFPKVKIIRGDGTLYWNGGMRVAFAKAMEEGYDYYLWLNDDTNLYKDALKKLIETENLAKDNDIIVTGTVIDPKTSEENYGGRRQKDRLHPLTFLLVEKSDTAQISDTFNGNVVLIPKSVTNKIGNIDIKFSKQHNGDIDYGLRAKYAGFETWVTPGIIGECSSNSLEGTIFDESQSLKQRIKQMRTPKGVPPAKEWMIFTKRHGGFLWPYFWFRTIIRVIFPFTYLFLRRPSK